MCSQICLGLKRLDDGSFVKDFDGPEKEVECPVQMSLSQVASQDPRFMERAAPPLSEEFPEGSKIFFLGEHAYGVAASVNSTVENALSIILAVGSSISSYVNYLTPVVVLPKRCQRECAV